MTCGDPLVELDRLMDGMDGEGLKDLVRTMARNMPEKDVRAVLLRFAGTPPAIDLSHVEGRVRRAIKSGIDNCDYDDDHDLCGRYLYPSEIAFDYLQNALHEEFYDEIEVLVKASDTETVEKVMTAIGKAIRDYDGPVDDEMAEALDNLAPWFEEPFPENPLEAFYR